MSDEITIKKEWPTPVEKKRGLTIMSLQEGGYIVTEEHMNPGRYNAPLCATSTLREALQFIFTAMSKPNTCPDE